MSESPRVLPSFAYAAAALALGHALGVSNGTYDIVALAWLTAALLLGLSGFFSLDGTLTDRFGERLLTALLALGACFQLYRALVSPYFVVLAFVVVACAFAPARYAWIKHASLVLILTAYVLSGVAFIKATPHPFIDIHPLHQNSLATLLNGENPYAITFPNIYPDTKFYGEGVVVNGVVDAGYAYPPLSLLIALPGYLIGGDYRYSNLIAAALAGLLMAYCRPGRAGVLAAGLFLFTPVSPYVLVMGWTEPQVVLLLVATIFCALRAPRGLPWALGLLIASKQYMPFALLFASLLGLGRRQALKALAVAFVITTPFALWDVGAFLKSAVLLHFRQPFRPDSLSYPALFNAMGIPRLTWMGFALFGAVCLWAHKRASRTAAAFAAAVALGYLLFFAFGKHAFSNYYYFIIGALCCAVAAASPFTSVVQAGRVSPHEVPR